MTALKHDLDALNYLVMNCSECFVFSQQSKYSPLLTFLLLFVFAVCHEIFSLPKKLASQI